jgi:hypothetical protein
VPESEALGKLPPAAGARASIAVSVAKPIPARKNSSPSRHCHDDGCRQHPLWRVDVPGKGPVFAIASDSVRHVPSFLILNVVPMPRIMLNDGLLVAASNSLRIPTAYSIIFERVGDLSGDRISDDSHVADLMSRPEFPADREAVSEIVEITCSATSGPPPRSMVAT